MQRVGVFVCWCGSNIAGTVDVQAVSEALKNEPGVVFSTNYQYMCSQAGQVGGQAVLRQKLLTTPWLTEGHGYDPTWYG